MICEKYPESYRNDRFKIILKGMLSPDAIPDIRSITGYLSQTLSDPRVEDKTKKLPDLRSISEENTLKGLFVAGILRRIDKTGSEEAKEELLTALEYGLNAFESEVNIIEDQLDIDR